MNAYSLTKYAFLASFLSICLSAFGAETGRTVLSGHVPAVVAKLAPAEELPATNQLTLALGLPLRHPAELHELLGEIYDPANTNFHKFLNPTEFADRFGPTAADYRAVRLFAESQGLTVLGTHSNRLVMDVSGSVAGVERAFGVSLHRYRHPAEARYFYAPDTEPSVPTNVLVADLWGLTDYGRPTPLIRVAPSTTSAPLNYNGSGSSGAYLGRDYRKAYVPGTALVGSGQVAAVVEMDGYFANDITNYEYKCGYTNVPLTNILLNAVSGTPGYSGVPNAVAEVSLDIELEIAMAPGLSRLIVYEGENPYTVFSRIASDNTAKQISSSWSWTGVGFTTEWLGRGSTLDALLSEMAAQGQSFFQASGDSDADTGSQSVSATNGPIPVDSIYLTSVGGTSLTMSGTGSAWSSEAVWNWGNNEGSSGGVSSNYTIPTWQTNVSMSANSGSTAYRNFPDVALTADAVEVVYSNGITAIFGGTSCAAPLWAGFTALVNQQATAYGRTNVGFLNPALYAIAASTNYTNCFHDITSGNNIGTDTAGLYYAVTGYDLATGLGTPNGINLINALAPPTAPFFTSQPASQSVTNGATVIFSATASGQSPLSYRWLLNGTNLSAGSGVSGTASTTLTITAVTSTNAGSYQLVATNIYSAVTSSVATLTVTFPPSFTTEPTNEAVVAGGTANFSATVIGGTPLAYQWRQNGTNLASGSFISGATNNALTFTSVASANAGNYTLVATNIFGAATSSVAVLIVWVPAAITVGPVAQTIQCGSNASFAVTAAGASPLLYQWSVDGSAVAGATNTSLALTAVHLPSHTVAIVVTNLYGSATSSVGLTVQDTLPPSITLNSTNPYNLELGNSYVEPGATADDLCAGTVLVSVSGSVNTAVVSTNTVTYTASDGNGNTATGTRTVIVRDTTPPTISWSFTNLVMTANSNCEAVMPNVTGTNYIIATDASGTLTFTQTPTNNATLPQGTNLVVITVADASGNKSYSTNSSVVQDVTPPTITLNGANPLLTELGATFQDPGATATDTCSGVALLMTNGAVNVSVVGTNLLSYLAVDGNNNTNSVTRTVIVRDATPPTILWSFTNLVLAANSNCEAVLPNATGTNFILATDLSGVATISQTPTNGAVLPVGTNVVVIAVADSYGNTAYSTNQAVVQDQTPPVITLNGANPYYVQFGAAFMDPGVTASDTCSGIAQLTTNGTVNVSAVGTNLLTYIAVDGSGNTNIVTRTVIVQDTTPPTIWWSFTNLVLAANSNCEAVLNDVTGTNFVLATDLSGVATLVQTPTNGAVLPLGTNVVIIAVADPYGNSAYSTNTVMVQDVTPPTITLNGANPDYVQFGDIFTDAGVTAGDTCSGMTQLTTNGTVNLNAVGTNLLTYIAADGSGNTNSVTRTVIVQDTTPPTVWWSFTNLVLAANSNCEAVLTDLTGTNFILATDLSGVATLVQTPTNGAVLPLGTNVVVIAAADQYGNTAFSTNQVVVEDETPPVITLNGPNPYYDQFGATFTDPGATAVDTCSAIAQFTTNGTVNVSVVGTNMLIYVAVDASGNTNSVTRTVIVRDTTPPTIWWSFTNLVLAANSNCEAVLNDVTGTNFVLATDLSGVATLVQTPTNGAVLPLGTNVVIIAVADPYGNLAYATNQVVVQDQAPPVIWAQPQSQTNFAGTNASLSVVASACTPLAFQWFFDGVAMEAQTNAALVLSNVAAGAAGNYAVAVTAAGGSVTSAVAVLTVSRLSAGSVAVSLESSANPCGYKDDLIFNARMTPTNATGTVQFLTNGSAFDVESLVGGSAASIGLATLLRGTNLITALYSGDGTYPPATNALAQVVTNHPPGVSPAYFSLVAGRTLSVAVTNLATNWNDVDGDTLFIASISPSTNGVVVTNALPTLYYANSSFVNDLFVCSISDGFGGTNFQTVYITVVAQTNTTPVVALTPSRSTGLTLQLGGAAGATYVLKYSTNLAAGPWMPLATNVPGLSGIWQYTNLQTTNGLDRFFRLQLVTP